MYADLYKSQNHRVEISAMQIFTAAMIVMVTLVIPATYIQYNISPIDDGTPYTAQALRQREIEQFNNEEETGRVAGASDLSQLDTNQVRVPFSNVYIDLDSKSGLITIGGVAVFLMGACLLMYALLLDTPEAATAKKTKEAANYTFERNSLSTWN